MPQNSILFDVLLQVSPNHSPIKLEISSYFRGFTSSLVHFVQHQHISNPAAWKHVISLDFLLAPLRVSNIAPLPAIDFWQHATWTIPGRCCRTGGVSWETQYKWRFLARSNYDLKWAELPYIFLS